MNDGGIMMDPEKTALKATVSFAYKSDQINYPHRPFEPLKHSQICAYMSSIDCAVLVSELQLTPGRGGDPLGKPSLDLEGDDELYLFDVSQKLWVSLQGTESPAQTAGEHFLLGPQPFNTKVSLKKKKESGRLFS